MDSSKGSSRTRSPSPIQNNLLNEKFACKSDGKNNDSLQLYKYLKHMIEPLMVKSMRNLSTVPKIAIEKYDKDQSHLSNNQNSSNSNSLNNTTLSAFNKQDASIPSSETEMSIIIKSEIKRLVNDNKKYIDDERNENAEPNKMFSTSYDYSTYEDPYYYQYQPMYQNYDERNVPVMYSGYQYPPNAYVYTEAPQNYNNYYQKPARKTKDLIVETKSGTRKVFKGNNHADKKKESKTKAAQKQEKKEQKKKEQYVAVTNKPATKVDKKPQVPKITNNKEGILGKIKSKLYNISNDPRRAKSREPEIWEDDNDKASLSARGINVEPSIQGKIKKNAMMNILKFGNKKESCTDFMNRFRRNYNKINSEFEKVKLNRRKMSVDDSMKADSHKKGAESDTD